MKIRVGIVDTDSSFIERFCQVMAARYGDVEIICFPTLKQAETAAKNSLLNLLLIDHALCSNLSAVSIPTHCKVAILVNDKRECRDSYFPAVLRYRSLEEWHRELLALSGAEETGVTRGGAPVESGTLHGRVCLSLSGDGGSGAAAVATFFCRFLKMLGITETAVFDAHYENGEEIWRAAGTIAQQCDLLALCIGNRNRENIVIPMLNADQIVLVSDGTPQANKEIEKLLREMPVLTMEPKSRIYGKTALLYSDYDIRTGSLIRTDEITKLGGLDSGRNIKAAFEKLVVLCTRK